MLRRHVVCQEHYFVCTIAAVSEVKYSSQGHRMQRSTTSSADETRSEPHETSSFNTSTTLLHGTDDACSKFDSELASFGNSLSSVGWDLL